MFFLLCYASMRLQLFQYMHVSFCYLWRLIFCLSFSFLKFVPWHLAFFACSLSVVSFLSNKLWKIERRWNVLAHIISHGCICIIFCSRKFLYFFPCRTTFCTHHSSIFHASLSWEELGQSPNRACEFQVLCRTLSIPVWFYGMCKLG